MYIYIQIMDLFCNVSLDQNNNQIWSLCKSRLNNDCLVVFKIVYFQKNSMIILQCSINIFPLQ